MGGGSSHLYDQQQAGPSRHSDARFCADTIHTERSAPYSHVEGPPQHAGLTFSLGFKPDVADGRTPPIEGTWDGFHAEPGKDVRRRDSGDADAIAVLPASQIHPWAAPFSLKMEPDDKPTSAEADHSAASLFHADDHYVFHSLAQETSSGAAPDEVPVHPAIHSLCSRAKIADLQGAKWPTWRLDYALPTIGRVNPEAAEEGLGVSVARTNSHAIASQTQVSPRPAQYWPKALAKAQLYARETGTRLDLRALWAYRIQVEVERRRQEREGMERNSDAANARSRVFLPRNIRWAMRNR